MFSNWLFPPQPPLKDWRITLFTRQGCWLCDKTSTTLRTAQRRYGFALETIDVDSDPELIAKYGEQVPVVTVNGKVRFRGCVNAVLLERLLRAGVEGFEKGS